MARWPPLVRRHPELAFGSEQTAKACLGRTTSSGCAFPFALGGQRLSRHGSPRGFGRVTSLGAADQAQIAPFGEDTVDLNLCFGNRFGGCLFATGRLRHHRYQDV